MADAHGCFPQFCQKNKCKKKLAAHLEGAHGTLLDTPVEKHWFRGWFDLCDFDDVILRKGERKKERWKERNCLLQTCQAKIDL